MKILAIVLIEGMQGELIGKRCKREESEETQTGIILEVDLPCKIEMPLCLVCKMTNI